MDIIANIRLKTDVNDVDTGFFYNFIGNLALGFERRA